MLSPSPQLNLGNPTVSSLARHSVEPFVSAATLLAAAHFGGEIIDHRYLIAALLIVAVAFPGEWPTTTTARFSGQVAVSSAIQSCLFLLLGLATGTLSLFPIKVMLFWAILAPVTVFGACLLLKRFALRLRPLLGRKRKAVLVGSNTAAQKFLAAVVNDSLSQIEVVGIFDDRNPPRTDLAQYAPLLGDIAAAAEYCRSHTIDRIYVTLPISSHPRILRLLDELNDTTASVYFVPDIFICDLIQARVDTLNGIPVLAICETPFLGISGVIKHASDIFLASLILVLISPLMLAIAIGVKLSSPGPVLFRQRRYGLDGKEIVVYKFRSMTVWEDGDHVQQAHRNDARVTRFGAFMRRTSLDELPQFINVLQGRMSIVGPRPHAVAHNEIYRKVVKGYMVRHKVKPGITGWAQINGLRGETDTVDKMQKRIAYDLDYLRNWSLLLDLWIVLRTALLVLGDRNNAY